MNERGPEALDDSAAKVAAYLGAFVWLLRLAYSRCARAELAEAIEVLREGNMEVRRQLARMRAERNGGRPPLAISRSR